MNLIKNLIKIILKILKNNFEKKNSLKKFILEEHCQVVPQRKPKQN